MVFTSHSVLPLHCLDGVRLSVNRDWSVHTNPLGAVVVAVAVVVVGCWVLRKLCMQAGDDRGAQRQGGQ